MTTANTRARRIAAVGALVVAAAAIPALAELTVSSSSTTTATGTCLAWFGSRGDGQCLSYSNNNVSVGTPQVGIGGPNSGSPGVGISTGPLLPGQTISIPMG
ncbi:hypothetical protein [Mycobacterium sp. RTGN5]|uniref:DUF7155 family protein n=1 Tax=Mycobacterium sp. RTGN5 TaxID=3016522 RepID=UPI0029C8F26F|nr:hypothetical protein [Mycobacterium sp. RTGN5]